MDVETKAKRAEAILTDEVFIECLDMVLCYHMDVFRDPNATQDEVMEAHRMVRALSLIEGQLKSFSDSGKLQKRRIEAKQNVK